MHSYILTSTNQEDYLTQIQHILNLDHPITVINNPDLKHITNQDAFSIKIDQIRQLQIHNQHPPTQNPHLILIIENAHTMTQAAQNALLKLLEEPQPETKIFLITDQIHNLLPPILSRCQIIKQEKATPPKHDKHSTPTIKDLTTAPLTKRLSLIEPITKDRTTAKRWITTTIKTCQTDLKSQTAQTSLKQSNILIRNLQTAHADLESNVNVKLVMDHLVLNLEKE